MDAPREALHVDPTPVAPIIDAVDLALVETPRLVALIVVKVEEGAGAALVDGFFVQDLVACQLVYKSSVPDRSPSYCLSH